MNNFKIAYTNATRGKKHYTDVKFIERRGINRYLRKLLRDVRNGTYEVSDYDVFDKFTGEKWRTIYRLPMKDRIVQHAIMNYLEPVFRETFIIDTYSSIKGRGTHKALKRLKHMLKDNPDYLYCLSLDIHKCYPSLDQTILKEKLAKKFEDKRLLNLLFKIVDSCDKGVPIGNYTSQYFNNLYFNDFDHYMKEVKQCKIYIRYCDNITICGHSKEELRNLFLKTIVPQMEELHVTIKPTWQIFSIETRGIDALGYVIRRSYVRLRKRNKNKFKRACSKINFDNPTDKDINVLGSYWGLLKHADCRTLWKRCTGMKDFKELQIKVSSRDFIKNVLDKEIIVKSGTVYYRKGEKKVKIRIEANGRESIISTGGECLIEAIEQIKKADYPFKTTIKVDNNGYYIFT